MAFINKYPYTDFHELNADFILKELCEVDAAKVNSVGYENSVEDTYKRQVGTLTVSDGHRNAAEITNTILYESTYAHDQEATEGSAHTVSGGALYAEQAARIAADEALQTNIDAEADARQEADEALQTNIDAEETARQEADEALQENIDAEETARQEADEALTVIINEYGSNQLLLTDDTANESATFTNYEAGAGADVQLAETVATNTANITANAGAIDTLQENMTTAEGEIDTLQTTSANHEARIEALEEGAGGGVDISDQITALEPATIISIKAIEYNDKIEIEGIIKANYDYNSQSTFVAVLELPEATSATADTLAGIATRYAGSSSACFALLYNGANIGLNIYGYSVSENNTIYFKGFIIK